MWEGRLWRAIISSHHPLASLYAALNQLLVLWWGRKWKEKAIVKKKAVVVRQLPVYSSDSKRLSHEGLISAASQFCRRIKQQCEGNIRQKAQKTPLKWAYSTVCSCSWESCSWFLWTSVSERWIFLSLWLFSMFFISPHSTVTVGHWLLLVGWKSVCRLVLLLGHHLGRRWHEQMG